MLDTFKTLIENQFEAALCTLNACIDRCPETAWDAPVGNHAFCQVVFHTLFYGDLYLERNTETFRRQSFHRDNEHFFGDYEEFEDRAPQSLYAQTSIKKYMEFCRSKVSEVVASETVATLDARSGFAWLECSRAEVHLYNIRHIQHHAAQLSLRLRIDTNEAIPWIRSGWRDV